MAEVAPNLHKKTPERLSRTGLLLKLLTIVPGWVNGCQEQDYTCVFWVAVSGWSWSHTIATRSDSQPAPHQDRYWSNSTSVGQVGFSARGVSNLGRPLCPATEVSVHPCSGTGKLCRRDRGHNRGSLRTRELAVWSNYALWACIMSCWCSIGWGLCVVLVWVLKDQASIREIWTNLLPEKISWVKEIFSRSLHLDLVVLAHVTGTSSVGPNVWHLDIKHSSILLPALISTIIQCL